MKKNISNSFLSIAIASMAIAPMTTHALMVDTSTKAQLNTTSSTDTDSGVYTQQQTQMQTGSKTNMPFTSDTSVSNSTTTGSGTVNTAINSSDTSGVLNASFTITRDSLEGEEAGNAITYTAQNEASVSDEASLSAYVKALIASDANISKVKMESDTVSLWYQESGKFLGFIPVSMNAQATVKEDGAVTVRYPWYRFLTKATSDKNALESTLGARVEAVMSSQAGSESGANASGNATASATLTVQKRARILREMRNAFKDAMQSSASVDSDTRVQMQ